MTYEAASGSTRTVTAFFDERDDADEAVERLVAAGIARDRIRIVAGQQPGTATTATASTREKSGGFWDSLADLFMPDEDRYTYAEGLRRGGYLVTVTATDSEYEQALDILDDEGTIDIDERASAWRSEGWSGYDAGAATLGGTGGTDMSARSRTDRVGMTGDEEVIPVTEEEIRIGKRDVSHGRVRVRSYVVETPVSESVNLREETVHVERRPVDRATTGDENLFQDRTIEMEEHDEEAVVSKEARVREEVVIGKDVRNRSETVSDTVRRTEVEIDDERSDIGSERRSGSR